MAHHPGQTREEFIASLKPDTAYMEVPRCDQCRFWQTHGVGSHECVRQDHVGAKFSADEGGEPILTEAGFGCAQFEARQPEDRKP